MKLTDEELLRELEVRFTQRNSMIEEQKQFLHDLEKVNKKLVESEKLKSDFLSNIKNEINNPITSMLGLLKLMLSNPDNQEKNKMLTNLVYHETYILNFHLQNIFFAAEIEAGNFTPDWSRVTVNEMIQVLGKSLTDAYYKKGISINYDLQAHDEFVTDRNKIEIIISNLISNAIKFSHNDQAMDVITRNGENESIIIEVKDYGVGISDEDLDRVFDRFQQLDTGTTKEFGGHGLGLSVVQSVLEILNGKVEVTSKVDEGTTFVVEVPAGSVRVDDVLFDMDDEFLFDTTDEENDQVF